VNAQHIKNVPGRKTNQKDAEWIAQLQHGLLRPSYVPCEIIRDLRDLTRMRASLSQEASRISCRVQKVLEDANVKLASVATNTVGKSGRAMLEEITIGLDLGDRWSFYCVLDEAGQVILEQKLPTTPEAMKQTFGKIPRSLIALETGTHSPWVSRLLTELGHEVIVAHAQKVQWITKSNRKDDRHDARTLARLTRIDPVLLGPVRHRSVQAQFHLTVIRARAELVSVRTALVNAARGLVKAYRERLPKCGTYQVSRDLAAALSTELRDVLEPLLKEIESLNERVKEYDERMEKIAKEVYPEVSLLKQVKGVETQIALTYVLTIEDPYQFPKSRQVGCFLGLRPGRRNSGESEPQKGISKEGDRYLRTMMVQGAHYILGPFGENSDLRRWGTQACGARRKKCQEASRRGRGSKAGGTTASVVGGRRGVRTTAQ
jgi:transposase